MANNIGARVELAGEKEFRQALSQINAGLKTTASELKLVTARYSENADSVAGLTAKNEALQKKLDQQREKVETLRKALENAKTQYGETDTKTLKWQQSLNLAEAELIQVDEELKKNSEALEEAKKNMEKYGLSADEVADKSQGLGGIISDLADKLGINLPAGAENAIRSLDNTKAATLALAGAVAGLVKKFADATIETAKHADEILTLATTTGLTTDQVQELMYAEEQLDVSLETISGSLSRMIRNMDNARKGTGDAADAFRKLHVRVTDARGQLKDAQQVFYEVVDALGKVRNETERDALAMAIFGRSARELNPLIEAGSNELRRLAAEAHEVGYALNNETLGAFGGLDDEMQEFQKRMAAFRQTIGMVLLPVLTTLFEILNKIDPKVLAIAATWGTMAITAFTLIKGITQMAAAWATYSAATAAASATTVTATATTAAFGVTGLKVVAIIIAVVAALTALAATIAIIAGKGQDLNKAMANVTNTVTQSAANATASLNKIGSNMPQYRYVSGSHKDGLDYVPYDGYIAELHRGERVVPADQNRRGGLGDTFIINIQADKIKSFVDIVEMAERERQRRRAGKLAHA